MTDRKTDLEAYEDIEYKARLNAKVAEAREALEKTVSAGELIPVMGERGEIEYAPGPNFRLLPESVE